MPVKLSTTLENIELLENKVNSKLISQFYNYLQSNNTSESYQNQNIKALINLAKFLGPSTDFYQLSKKEDILAFLNTKIKIKEIDPDGKWIRTWNDYLQRIKYFIRWIYNEKQRIDDGLELNKEAFNLTQLLQNIINDFKDQIIKEGNSHYLEFEFISNEKDQVYINADKNRINQGLC
jgi:hypothetical protein